MADRVLPTVRLIFPCDDAVFDLADGKWQVKNPWGSVVALPPGTRFPFRAEEAWVYIQLTDGVGSFELAVELRQVRDDRTYRTAGWSEAVRHQLPGGNQLFSFDTAFHLKKLPFREAGVLRVLRHGRRRAGGGAGGVAGSYGRDPRTGFGGQIVSTNPNDGWTTGRLVSLNRSAPPVVVDCSSWDAGPAGWLEVVVSFDDTARPAAVYGQTLRLINALHDEYRRQGIGLEYDTGRSRTDGDRVVVALRLTATASAEQRERAVAIARAELGKVTGARLERVEWAGKA